VKNQEYIKKEEQFRSIVRYSKTQDPSVKPDWAAGLMPGYWNR